jgi:hypothetical protein
LAETYCRLASGEASVRGIMLRGREGSTLARGLVTVEALEVKMTWAT